MKTENRRKWNRVIAGVMFMMLLLAAVPVQVAEAASATITLTTDMEEIHAGDTVEVELTISADATIGDFETFISYDETIFEFYSAASCITGGSVQNTFCNHCHRPDSLLPDPAGCVIAGSSGANHQQSNEQKR